MCVTGKASQKIFKPNPETACTPLPEHECTSSMKELLEIEMKNIGDSCSLDVLGQKLVFQAFMRRNGRLLAGWAGEVPWFMMDTNEWGIRTTISRTEPIDYNLLFASQPKREQLPTPLIPVIVFEHIVMSGIEGVDMTVIMRDPVCGQAIKETGCGLSVLVKGDARVIMKMKMKSKVVYYKPE